MLSTYAPDLSATNYYFFIQFRYKNNIAYSLSNPSAFLSQRALDRRNNFGIECDSTDIPVNSNYISQISVPGIKIHSRSKWLNGITIIANDTSVIQQIRQFNFVKTIQYTGKIDFAAKILSKIKFASDTVAHGGAEKQVSQINLKKLHDEGFTGNGVLIGILDGGFYKADVNPGLDSLRLQGRLLGTKDIISVGNNVFNEDVHGANVLSIMSGNLPGQFVGTAPKASYWLIRTEYSPTENLFETDFWTAGIEFADSLGVDIINSSLGYTTFDDSTMNYTYQKMNGQFSRASLAAGMAAKKGIFVCNSAGNDGNKTWHYIGAPADATNIFAVGSVTSDGLASSFTSFGPASDGRIKPDVCGMGTATAIINSSGLVAYGNGTSYSSPVIAGALACLLQKYKTIVPAPWNMEDFRNAVIGSSSLYNTPTQQLGYGIPDFAKSEQILLAMQGLTNFSTNESPVKLHLIGKNLVFTVNGNYQGKRINYIIYDLLGCKISSGTISGNVLHVNCENFTSGIYIANIVSEKNRADYKFIISR